MSIGEMNGVVIGLTIWGLFYVAMFFIEASLVGGMIRAAGEGLRTLSSGVGRVMSGSSSSRREKSAQDIAGAVRDELLEDRRVRHLGKEIRRAVDRLESDLDPAKRRRQLEKLLDNVEVDAAGDRIVEPSGVTPAVAATVHAGSDDGARLRKAGHHASASRQVVEEEAATDERPADSTVKAGMRLAGMSREEAEAYQNRFEDFLRRADDEALDPDGLKDDLEQLFDDPRRGWDALRARFRGADRDTFRGLLVARGMSEERAERVTSRAESVLRSSARKAENRPSLRAETDDRLRDWLSRVDDPRLRYEELHDELVLLFDDPRAGSDAIIRRLRSLDRESIQAMLASRRDTSEEDAEQMLQRIEAARDEVIERTEKAQAETKRRVEQARQKSLEAAEEARHIAAGAAWWAFAAATASGAAAAIGGIVGVSTGIG